MLATESGARRGGEVKRRNADSSVWTAYQSPEGLRHTLGGGKKGGGEQGNGGKQRRAYGGGLAYLDLQRKRERVNQSINQSVSQSIQSVVFFLREKELIDELVWFGE